MLKRVTLEEQFQPVSAKLVEDCQGLVQMESCIAKYC